MSVGRSSKPSSPRWPERLLCASEGYRVNATGVASTFTLKRW